MLILSSRDKNIYRTMTKSEMLKLGGFPIQVGDFLSPATFWGCKVDKNSDLLQMETKMTELFQKGNATPLSKPVVGVVSWIFSENQS